MRSISRAFNTFLCFIILSACTKLSFAEDEKFLNGFIDYLNNLPEQPYVCEDGILINSHATVENVYNIDVSLKVSETQNRTAFKLLKCSATIHDEGDSGIRVEENGYQCHEDVVHLNAQTESEVKASTADQDQDGLLEEPPTTEVMVQEAPVKLDNEVQSDTAASSGEQFVAIPRHSPVSPCIGCSSPVVPTAPGVRDLALLGVRHLNRHRPAATHTLLEVLEVERQVQVVNGVRYILTLKINCTATGSQELEKCNDDMTCKISVLEKPWLKLPNGSKFRAILANNCTEEWQFGDDGEVLPSERENKETNDIPRPNDDTLKVIHLAESQATPNHERTLTEDEIKQIEEQIIPETNITELTDGVTASGFTEDDRIEEKTLHVKDINQASTSESISQTDSNIKVDDKANSLSEQKIQAIDDLINFFEYAGLGSDSDTVQKLSTNRIKRSYLDDLQLLSLAKNYRNLRKSVDNGRHVYSLAEVLVNYMNEMDIELKTRFLIEVTTAVEEYENHQHFVYLQAKVAFPCNIMECKDKEAITKICNAIIDDTDTLSPQVLSHFCYEESKNKNNGGKFNDVPLDDPILQKLSQDSLKKIEKESSRQNALIITKLLRATTQRNSGVMTKMTFEIAFTNCNKSIPIKRRSICNAVETLGSQLCEVIVHEKSWSSETIIHYSCTHRNFGEKISPGNTKTAKPTDPKIVDMVQEALRQLEMQSNKNSKQKIVEISAVSTQLVAGLLTDIDFVVAYTTCSIDYEVNINSCAILKEEPLRKCHTQIWDRSWLEDGRQINVSCDDSNTVNNLIDNNLISRKKRSNNFVGGPMDQDSNDPKYRQLAEESLQKYVSTSGGNPSQKVLKIERVTTQAVSGSLTVIEFVIGLDGAEESDTINCLSKIWEQSWLKKKTIDVECNVANKDKLQIRGGKKEQDPNNPKYRQFAEESLQKYILSSGGNPEHKVIKVQRVTTQVVSGSLTVVEFVIGPDGAEDRDTISCRSKIWEQPWLKKKDIDVDCNVTNRDKRQVPGSHNEQDPNDPIYRQLAEESLQKYVTTSGGNPSHKVLKIERVTRQVVSGSLTVVEFVIGPDGAKDSDTINCRSEIWEQPWLNKKDIDVKCNISKRNQRQILGGETEQDPNDVQYKLLAAESLQKYVTASAGNPLYKVLKIKRVTTQVVSGTLTRVYFKIGLDGAKDSDTINCLSKIWEQSWLKKKDIDVDCNIDDRYKRQTSGGQKEQDPNDPKYRKFAEESLQQYVSISGGNPQHKVIKVDRVTTQVVSGSLTRIYFKIGPNGAQDSDSISCYSEIWEQPWLKKKDIKVNCNANKRVKRSIQESLANIITSSEDETNKGKRGTPKLHNDPKFADVVDATEINEEEYEKLAEEAAQKYQYLTESKFTHRVMKVIKVTRQVVEGTLTKIEFTMSPTKCLTKQKNDAKNCTLQKPRVKLHCRAEIWVKPWEEESKTVDVNCKQKKTVKEMKLFKKYYTEKKLGAPEEIDLSDNARDKRQARDDENEIEEDTKDYYAQRAVQYLNDASNTQNVLKLITVLSVQSDHPRNIPLTRMYIEVAYTYCLRRDGYADVDSCDEIEGLNHKLCYAKIWPALDDELVVEKVTAICDDNAKFAEATGVNIFQLVKASVKELEKSRDNKQKLIHQGEPSVLPSLNPRDPFKLSFVVATTNCSKELDLRKPENKFQCFVDPSRPTLTCTSLIWMKPDGNKIRHIRARCQNSEILIRKKRSSEAEHANITSEEAILQDFVQKSIEKLEMSSTPRYKQRLLQIYSHSTRITTGKVTTIDFDVGYTSCLKYEWVDDITKCGFLEHLPRRHCISNIYERLWIDNGINIEVTCEDDETPLETHMEFDNPQTATLLANEALKHIEAKYPHPKKQKIIRIYSVEKQLVAGLHYRLKVEVGITNCIALTTQENCTLSDDEVNNKFCRVNVWDRPWTDHPPVYRVSCDYQESASTELYHALQAEHLFYYFLETYKPTYVDDMKEMGIRYKIFEKNIKKIHELNTHERGTGRYAVTRFADLSYEEFAAKYLGLKTSLRDQNAIPMSKAVIPNATLPIEFDWRKHGAVTEVKDQGSCGSCWAFSVTGNIEGQYKLQSGKLISLSEQELVDCDKLDEGCNGGLPDNAYRAIEQMGGLELESDYPYEGENDKCVFNRSMARVQLSGAVNITSNETDMAKWLVRHGPISIGINANAMQFYVGGVSHPWRMLCSPKNLDHGVLIVGYGIRDYPIFHKKMPYWIVKNSWGPSWGEQGYYRVYRGDGTCGLNQMASSAVVAGDYPPLDDKLLV